MAMMNSQVSRREDQAEMKARELLKTHSFTINGLIHEVEAVGFKHDEADIGVMTLIKKEINDKR